MGSITDWLTSIGTVAAVVISLGFTVFRHYAEKKRRRLNLIWRIRVLADRLIHEIEAAPPGLTDIGELESYRTAKIYQQILIFFAHEDNGDLLVLGEQALNSLVDYFNDRSEAKRNVCLEMMKQVNTTK